MLELDGATSMGEKRWGDAVVVMAGARVADEPDGERATADAASGDGGLPLTQQARKRVATKQATSVPPQMRRAATEDYR